MVEADTWCPYVAVPVASATWRCRRWRWGLLTDHRHRCVVSAVRATEDDGHFNMGGVARTIRQVVRP
jgi:hypothetical protein